MSLGRARRCRESTRCSETRTVSARSVLSTCFPMRLFARSGVQCELAFIVQVRVALYSPVRDIPVEQRVRFAADWLIKRRPNVAVIGQSTAGSLSAGGSCLLDWRGDVREGSVQGAGNVLHSF